MENWHRGGSMTSAMPKKSRLCRQAGSILMSCPRERGRARGLNRLDTHGVQRFRPPIHDRREDFPQGFWILSVRLMNEATRILSAIERGDPHAAEQLLPL